MMLAANIPIREISYDAGHTKLTVCFETGGAHVFVGVPSEVHQGLCEAASPHDFLGERILGSYPYNVVAA